MWWSLERKFSVCQFSGGLLSKVFLGRKFLGCVRFYRWSSKSVHGSCCPSCYGMRLFLHERKSRVSQEVCLELLPLRLEKSWKKFERPTWNDFNCYHLSVANSLSVSKLSSNQRAQSSWLSTSKLPFSRLKAFQINRFLCRKEAVFSEAIIELVAWPIRFS